MNQRWKRLMRLKDQNGFTLVELIVVIAILGILAALVVPSVTGYVKTAQENTNQANAQMLYAAAQLYITDLEIAGKDVPATFSAVELLNAGYIQDAPKGNATFTVTAGSDGSKTRVTLTYTVEKETYHYPRTNSGG